MIANHLVYLSELNAKKIRVYTTSGKHLADVVSTGEFTASTPVVAAGHVVVSTFNGDHEHQLRFRRSRRSSAEDWTRAA